MKYYTKLFSGISAINTAYQALDWVEKRKVKIIAMYETRWFWFHNGTMLIYEKRR